MANPLYPHLVRGTVGELLTQIRLLQFDVQAAPPLEDSGNDLIAIRHKTIKTIQVKTRTADKLQIGKLPEFYDLLAVVLLSGTDWNLFLDDSNIYLIPRDKVETALQDKEVLNKFLLRDDLVNEIFGARHWESYGPLAT